MQPRQMATFAADLWERAKKALAVAKAVSSLDPDSAASRAYYAAFYAVSARFVLKGNAFRSKRDVVEYCQVTAAETTGVSNSRGLRHCVVDGH
jgi:uncharacterized protein (UPF0332 family)